MEGPAHKKVLVVDDSEAVCLAISMMLEKHGFEVKTAQSYAEGLTRMREQTFAVVLVDVNLGPQSGLDLAQVALRENSDCKLIIISGSVLLENEIKSRPTLKHTPILQKPFTHRELIECIRRAVDKAA
jgi:DNA-binding NtrC family response regulator